MHRLRKFITAECLAVAVFIVVAFGLWWGMPFQPEMTFSVPIYFTNNPATWRPERYFFSPKESMLAVHKARWVFVFDLDTGTELYRQEARFRQLAWSPEQKIFLARGEMTKDGPTPAGLITILDPRTGSVVDCFDHPQLQEAQFLLAPDGKTLAIHGKGETSAGFWLVDVPSRKEITSTMLAHKEPVNLLGFSPEGRFFLVRLPRPDGGQLMLYDVQNGKVTWRSGALRHPPLEDHHAFSPDGCILAQCQEKEQVVHLWDTHTGQAVGTIPVFQAIAAQGRTEQDQVLDDLSFVQAGSLLCVITSESHSSRRGRFWPPPEPLDRGPLWPSSANLNLFDVRTGQLVYRQLWTCHPTSNRNNTLLAMESHNGEDYSETCWTLRVRDLAQGREHTWRTKHRYHYDDCFGFVPWGPEREVFIYSDKVARENPDNADVSIVGFLDPVTGNKIDQWRLPFLDSGVTLSPAGKWLLVTHFNERDEFSELKNALDLYAFPPRRPWRHILGWALAAGLTVELLGLGRRGLLRFVRFARQQRKQALAKIAARKGLAKP